MNLNWQKYNALQEKHIDELNEKVEKLSLQLQSPNFSGRDQSDEQLKRINEVKCFSRSLKMHFLYLPINCYLCNLAEYLHKQHNMFVSFHFAAVFLLGVNMYLYRLNTRYIEQ